VSESLRCLYKDPQTAARYLSERFGRLPWSVADKYERARVAEIIDKSRPEKVLDLACGPGRITEGVSVPLGVLADANTAMLRESAGRGTGGWQHVCADAFSLPFPDSTFDFVCCFRFLRHHYKVEREKILGEIRRVLVPDGRLVFDALNAKMSKFAARYAALNKAKIHDEKYSPETLKLEMNACGFEVESLTPVMQHLRAYHMANIAARHRFFPGLRRRLVELGERVPSRFPFSWVVISRKR
jgi:ubiquinone/menaquinone biosynthesis C-methylase UbiE